MPCSDLTELIHVAVDSDGRLADYHFVKRTCGQAVGVRSLLLPLFRGESVESILELEPAAFLERFPVADPLEEFLSLKHLIALQSALEVLTGRSPGGAREICAVAEIGADGDAVHLDARIKLDLVTDRIKACGNCRSCGNARKKKAANG